MPRCVTSVPWLLRGLTLCVFACLNPSGGAADEQLHWAFQPLATYPLPPQAGNTRWASTPVDHFIAARRRRDGVPPASPADRGTFLRRLTMDLTGLPPALSELAEYERDRRPDATSRVVDRLLASPEYGIRWARHWLDVVRYTDYLNADPLGKNANPKFELYEAYRYRDWVIDAFNSDLPYDDFIRHQLAGDLLDDPHGGSIYPAGLIATTVLAIGFWENGCADKKKVVSDIVDDQIDLVGKAFLGITLSCSRCHDHKFDPITQEDYYGLAGIFYSSRVLASVGTKGDHTILLRTPLESTEDLARRQQSLAELASVEQEITRVKSQLLRAAKMVAWFDFEENTVATTADNVGGYLGRLHGDAVISEGRFGQGVTLDGDGDFVDGTAQADFQVKRGTIMAWFRFDADIRSEGQIVGMPFHSTKWIDPYYALQAWISPDGTHLGGQTNHHGTRLQTIYASSAELDVGPGEWHHIAAIYDGRFVRLVVDGRPVGAAIDGGSDGGGIHYDGNPNLTIGTRNVVDVGNYFKGTIDEVKLFDGALNATQIRAAMQSPVPQQFAVAFRDGTIPAPLSVTLEEQQAEIARKIQELEERAQKIRGEFPPEVPLAMAIQEGGTPDSLFPSIQNVPLHQRGRYDRLGAVVARRVPKFLPGLVTRAITRGSGRRELASWVTSPNNPLTPRVMVNRVWQYHFGQGIVTTANNFGKLGNLPTHPQLLDWLARWLTDRRGSLKQLHRLLVTSSTYRQSTASQNHLTHALLDRSWARMRPRRLTAEAIRDGMLAAADQLELVHGGPAFPSLARPRRSVYIQTRRFTRNRYATLFDAANPEQSVPRRAVTTTAPQALFLMNHPFVQQQATHLAARLARLRPDNPTARIRLAYRLLFSRDPTAEEMSLGKEFLATAPEPEDRWIDYAQLLLCSNEFFYTE